MILRILLLAALSVAGIGFASLLDNGCGNSRLLLPATAASAQPERELTDLIHSYQTSGNLKDSDLTGFADFSKYLEKYPFQYRGFSHPEYTEDKLVRLMLGDDAFQIESWDYSRLKREKMSQGMTEAAARVATSAAIAQIVLNEIHRLGVKEYCEAEQRKTVVGLAEVAKSGTALFFSNELDGAVHYTMVGAKRHPESAGETPLIVVKIPTNSKKYIPFHEDEGPFVSHITSEDLAGAFVGFGTKESIVDSGYAPDADWYYLERVGSGAQVKINVRSAKQIAKPGYPSWARPPDVTIGEVIVSSDAGAETLRKIAKERPRLARLLAPMIER